MDNNLSEVSKNTHSLNIQDLTGMGLAVLALLVSSLVFGVNQINTTNFIGV
jgi:hypothetical protein